MRPRKHNYVYARANALHTMYVGDAAASRNQHVTLCIICLSERNVLGTFYFKMNPN